MTQFEQNGIVSRLSAIRRILATVCDGRANGADLMVALLDVAILEDEIEHLDEDTDPALCR